MELFLTDKWCAGIRVWTGGRSRTGAAMAGEYSPVALDTYLHYSVVHACVIIGKPSLSALDLYLHHCVVHACIITGQIMWACWMSC